MSSAEQNKPRVSQICLKAPKTFFTVLLAGGPADMYRKLKEKLAASRGIFLKYHWEYKTNDFQGVLPLDVDFVLCIKDMMSHADHTLVKVESKKRKVPIVSTNSEMSVLLYALYHRGIRSQPQLDLRSIEHGPRAFVPHTPEPPKFNQVVHEALKPPTIGNKEISVSTLQCIQTLQRALLSEGIAVIMISKKSIEISQE